MTFVNLLLPCLMVLLAGALYATIPGYGRQAIFFSITVSDDFRRTPEARKILRQYRWRVSLGTLIATGIAFEGTRLESGWLVFLGVLVLVVSGIGAYANGRDRTRPYAFLQQAERVAELMSTEHGIPGGVLSLVGPFLVVIAAALYCYTHDDQIRDPLSTYGRLTAGIGMETMLLFAALAIIYGSRQGRFRRLNLVILAAFMWTTSIMSGLSAVLPLFGSWRVQVADFLPFVMLVFTIAIFVWAMRKISRMPDNRDYTPDECWKLGQFYYNPSDSSVLVERRFGLGYSLNFANWRAWAMVGILAALPMIILFVVSL